MPRQPIDRWYVERIKELWENERLSSKAITARIEELARQHGRHDYPSERSVRRILQEHRQAPEVEREAFRYAKWPDACLDGTLPWEAGPLLLALARAGVLVRKTTAVWLWRVSLAAPEAPFSVRVECAIRLAAGAIDPRVVEAFLIYRAWTAEGRAEATREGVAVMDMENTCFLLPFMRNMLDEAFGWPPGGGPVPEQGSWQLGPLGLWIKNPPEPEEPSDERREERRQR